MLVERIKEITEIQSISGFESKMRHYMTEQMAPYVDCIEYDRLGGVFGIIESPVKDAKTVMVAAHMDEVGFMVNMICPNGMLKVLPIGGWNTYAVSAQRFTLQTSSGQEIPVISAAIPPHLLRGKSNQELAVEDILFDAGFTSQEEALSFGVRPGDPIVPYSEAFVTANGQNMVAKAWDNRYGCLAILETLKQIDRSSLKVNVVIGCNVQEEVGLRGAPASAYQFKPDLFFAVDCSAANDMQTKEQTFGHLGEGFLLRVQDPRFIMLPRMKDYLLTVAEDEKIPYQYYISKGGTDAAAVQSALAGIPSAVIGVCARYIHTHHAMFNLADFTAAQQMLIAVLTDLDTDKVNQIIYGKEEH